MHDLCINPSDYDYNPMNRPIYIDHITMPKITKKAKRYLRIIKNLYFCCSINIVACLSVAKHNNLNFLL